MSDVSIGRIARIGRRPWYTVWNQIHQRLYRGRDYGLLIPYGQRIYMPWNELAASSEFSILMQIVESSGRLSVSPDRCYVLYHLSKSATLLFPGSPIAECGVYTGGTAQLIAGAVANSKPSAFHLFDSFEGMPNSAVPSRDYHKPGDFADTSEVSVRERLSRYQFCQFHVGFIPSTFEGVKHETGYSFVHIDVDIYESVRDCLDWFWPRMRQHSVIVFDDYGFYPYRSSARVAVDEFFQELPETPWSLPTGQAVVFKTT